MDDKTDLEVIWFEKILSLLGLKKKLILLDMRNVADYKYYYINKLD